MKGKHTNAAERRRHLAELEGRAAEAERRAERLQADLTELRQSSGAMIEALRAELREVKRQRDAGSHPKLQEADRVKRELLYRIGEAEGQLKYWHEAASALRKEVVSILKDRAGLSEPEINTVLKSVRDLGAPSSAYTELAVLAGVPGLPSVTGSESGEQ